MKSIYRLKKNYQYNYVYKHAKSVGDRYFLVLYCTSNVAQSKVGFSVSKKYGGAVERNRIRRQMKAVMSALMPQLKSGYNLVIIPRKSEAYLHQDIVASLTKLLHRAELL